MDPKLKALAAEYEKARKQNEKLRNMPNYEIRQIVTLLHFSHS